MVFNTTEPQSLDSTNQDSESQWGQRRLNAKTAHFDKSQQFLVQIVKHTSYPSFLSFLFYVWEICVCVCVCVHIRTCTSVCMCVRTYICACVHVCVLAYTQMHVCTYVHRCVYVCKCVHTCVHVCACYCVCIYMCMCVHVSVCMRACVWCVCVNINFHCSPCSGAGGGLSLNQELLSSQSN